MDLLDSGQLANLYDLAGSELEGMLEEFAKDGRNSLRQLEVACGEGKLEAGVELAHEVKGAAATLGLAALQGRLNEVEQALRDGQEVDVTIIRGLEPLLAESLEAVRGFLR